MADAPRLTRGFALLACAAVAGPPTSAHAEGDAGVRVFPVTLTIDDVDVTDEATIPLFTWQRSGAEGGPGPVDAFGSGAEYDKRITEDFGVGVATGAVLRSTARGKTRTGFDDVSVSLKYQAYVSPGHELLLAVGVVREFGRTGTSHIGADRSGFTAPAIYAGKGFPEAGAPWLRPLAVTATLGYQIADTGLKQRGGGFNDGLANRIAGGLSVQYSLPYLNEQVGGYDLPEFVAHLVPLVEVSYSSPTSSPSAFGTQTVFAPGVIYSSGAFQVGVEALIPANAASGTHVGVIAQVHLFFDDLLPDSLGKPLFD